MTAYQKLETSVLELRWQSIFNIRDSTFDIN